jgi:hypothetical protein
MFLFDIKNYTKISFYYNIVIAIAIAIAIAIVSLNKILILMNNFYYK